MQILIPDWDWGRNLASVTKVMLLLLVGGPHFEYKVLKAPLLGSVMGHWLDSRPHPIPLLEN